MRLLFTCSEMYPLIKTGGLADVAFSLPNALAQLGIDVHVVLPAYRDVLATLGQVQLVGWLRMADDSEVRVLSGSHPDIHYRLLLIDVPQLFDRDGLPYTDRLGHDWPDNSERFALFSEACAALASGALQRDWQADVVHANDWQTGLVPAFLKLAKSPPRSLFTIHNIAYDCQIAYGEFQRLGLPTHWWSIDHGEFYGQLSMLKCGLTFSDLITTVSPSYAREIRSPEFGYGYASILEQHANKLFGVLNGIDDQVWNPRDDEHLVANYHASGKIRSAKRANRVALLSALGASDAALSREGPLVGSVGRLVHQKGIDLLLDAIPPLLDGSNAQFVVVGSGDSRLEQRLTDLAHAHPHRVFCHLGYSESYAHLLEAGCDIFAMPSRYEPCGLNQMYSLRYGTPPVVRATGGLADTVVDATPRSIAREEANGFVFETPSTDALQSALQRAIELHDKPKQWSKLIKIGMRADYGWRRSAEEYVRLYEGAPAHG